MRKNILKISVVFSALFLSFGQAWGGNTYYAKVTAAVTTGSPTGSGTVYVDGNTGSNQKPGTGNNSANVSFSLTATPNSGYHFIGWYNNAAATGSPLSSSSPYTHSVTANSTNSGSPTAQTVYGDFAANKYTVTYSPNGGDGVAMSSSSFTYNSDSNILKTNTYTKTLKITFNTCGGNPISPANYFQTFKEWNSSFEGPFSNGANLKTLAAENGSTVELSARWNAVSVTLPTPTKTVGGALRNFLGWYDAESEGNRIGGAGSSVQMSENTTLYARWEEYTITLNVNASGFKAGEKAVFTVTSSDFPSLKYNIPVDLSSNFSVRIKGLSAGSYTVAPTGWSWDYVASPQTSTKTVNSDTTFSFSMSSRGSSTVHDEQSMKNTWPN